MTFGDTNVLSFCILVSHGISVILPKTMLTTNSCECQIFGIEVFFVLWCSVNRYKQILVEITLKVVLVVADLERKDVNMDLIKVEGKVGGRL